MTAKAVTAKATTAMTTETTTAMTTAAAMTATATATASTREKPLNCCITAVISCVNRLHLLRHRDDLWLLRLLHELLLHELLLHELLLKCLLLHLRRVIHAGLRRRSHILATATTIHPTAVTKTWRRWEPPSTATTTLLTSTPSSASTTLLLLAMNGPDVLVIVATRQNVISRRRALEALRHAVTVRVS
jgi:hypothetical protein